jgi:hypothetical protein
MKTETTHTHTQGPWKAYFYGKDSYGRIIATVGANDGCNRICEISPFDLPENEVEANARLISVAPELLDALENLIDTTPSDFDCEDNLEQDPSFGLLTARAAIAKAEGNA